MNFRNKKGQAAMEFLMTYGWAILIAIIAIAALIAFGVLNPPVQETCGTGGVVVQGMNCNSVKAVGGSGTITISVTNNLDKALYIKDEADGDLKFNILSPGTPTTLSHTATGTVIKIDAGETKDLVITDATYKVPDQDGKALKGDLKFTYCFNIDATAGTCITPLYDASVRIVQKIASS